MNEVQVREALKSFVSAKLAVDGAKETFRISLREFIKEHQNDSGLAAFVGGIYWADQECSSIVSSEWRSSSGERQFHASPVAIERSCVECRAIIPAIVTSWSALRQKPNDPYFRCKECEESRSRQSNEEWAAKDERRRRELHELRTMPYSDYLRTNHWQELRLRKLRSAKGHCSLCHRTGIQLHVHHSTYERRGQEYLNDLIVLCSVCHSEFHQKLGMPVNAHL